MKRAFKKVAKTDCCSIPCSVPWVRKSLGKKEEMVKKKGTEKRMRMGNEERKERKMGIMKR